MTLQTKRITKLTRKVNALEKRIAMIEEFLKHDLDPETYEGQLLGSLERTYELLKHLLEERKQPDAN